MASTEIRNKFTTYIVMVGDDYKTGHDQLLDWLRFRLNILGRHKVSDLSDQAATALYNDMVAAFPLLTVALNREALSVVPVPYQSPLPSVTPELAERVWSRLYTVLGPNALTVQQVMQIMQESVDTPFPETKGAEETE